MAQEHLTERQKKWFASVREGLLRDTGRSLEDWVAIARTCPHATPKARVDWLRSEHGLGVNRASTVLAQAFPSSGGWDDAEALRAALWKEPAGLAILDAIEAAMRAAGPVVVGQRKTYTAFSREVQFAAARPRKGGRALLGLKLDPALSQRLSAPTRQESWSERLTAVVELDGPDAVDGDLADLIARAWANGG